MITPILRGFTCGVVKGAAMYFTAYFDLGEYQFEVDYCTN